MPQSSGADQYVYERHRPEETPLYGIVETYYPQFLARLEAEGGSLPAFVRREFDDYLKCGLLEHGFLRVKGRYKSSRGGFSDHRQEISTRRAELPNAEAT